MKNTHTSSVVFTVLEIEVFLFSILCFLTDIITAKRLVTTQNPGLFLPNVMTCYCNKSSSKTLTQ